MPLATAHAADVRFNITLPADTSAPLSGRLVITLASDHANLPPDTPLLDAPFWDDPQPIFSLPVTDWKPGATLTIDDAALAAPEAVAFPTPLATLPPGPYRAQARLIAHRPTSDWRSAAGNRYSDEVSASIPPASSLPIILELTHATFASDWPAAANSPAPALRAERFQIRSALLSAFHGHDVFLTAGVVPPLDAQPARRYPAIYEVPGFGGTAADAVGHAGEISALAAALTAASEDSRTRLALARNAYWIVLDPESPNGHTLFADSDNNGPVGRALTEELIPALEARYQLIPQPAARLLRGHSSGGWSTIWLALTYPATFGAAWSSSPDPVDFRSFQQTNIYTDDNMYTTAAGAEKCSYRRQGREFMSVRQENGGEQALGPHNTSGQQWDSWQAVFGPRDDRGHPAALFDWRTGALDHTVAAAYARYDIARLLREHPQTYAPLFRARIRIICGSADNFYLNEPVALLQAELDQLDPPAGAAVVTLVPGLDHGTIFRSPAIRAIPGQMLDHLRRANLFADSQPASTSSAPAPASASPPPAAPPAAK